MKSLLILPYFLLLFVLHACKKEIKPEKGGIDVISNVYFDASKGLEKMQSFHLSMMNYSGDTIIEIVPDFNFPEINKQIFYIKDSLYYSLRTDKSNEVFISEVVKNKGSDIANKKEGAQFSKEWIPNYNNRKNLNDTILFKKNYKRFEINSPWSYTRFYVFETDTILPYSLYKHAEIDYHGRLERIDSYNKKTDVFVTLQIIPRKTWDREAQEIFDFNQFLKSKKK
ncbi:hypothetical protein [Chryseobacterium scophthalmum]|uniref:hypothetical protein n=1 Tax=Chryseobacterium scophthalmum TaxID=59733 RepID=UPI001AEC3A3E|nr:hypothetical protein [Chryseobacterium scophthalmum]